MKLFLTSSLLLWCFHGLSGVTDKVSVMEGDSVTLHTGVERNKQDPLKWYFKDILIAQINRNESQICTEDQCKERFRDRLKLDHQTGSLTITNTTNTDSGEYILKIFSSSDSEKIVSVTVHAVPGSGPSSAVPGSGPSSAVPGSGPSSAVPGLRRSSDAVGAMCAGVVLLLTVAVVAVFYYRHRSKRNEPWIQNNNNHNRKQHNNHHHHHHHHRRHHHHQETGEVPLNPTETSHEGVANETSTTETDRPLMAADN